ncbi:MAG TPA: 2-dehydropantoate 2-reductase, partial [Desulfobulbaceae bacterium]|nr:2-dehydropantoate 2-reductase [Desulfobulbaceae bacterium]
MLQDTRAGRPTEIEAINGAVVRLGQKLGVATPVNAEITRQVRALAQK